MPTPEHLGGHMNYTNMDEGVLAYLRDRFGVRTMLDVGCGPGGMIDVASRLGIEATGIDGDPELPNRPDVLVHDFTTGSLGTGIGPVDLIWSVEFVEHVGANYLNNILAAFRLGKVLFVTHAVPGQAGHHHVNCQDDRYWIDALSNDGWELDNEATAWVRANHTAMFFNTGMVFVRSQPSTVDVWMATGDTPIATETALRSLQYYNADISFRIVLACPENIESIMQPIADVVGAELLVTPCGLHTGHVLQRVFNKREYGRFVLILDSDVIFHEHGVIQRLLECLNDESVYCAGTGPKTTYPHTVTDPSCPHWWGNKSCEITPHIPTCCALIRNTPLFRRCFSEFGQYYYMRASEYRLDYWDGGVWADVMETHGFHYAFVDVSDGFTHFGGGTWIAGRYEQILPALSTFMADHGWKPVEQKPRRIYDCFMFNDELDILELRLAMLWDVVDVFVLVESPYDFKGNRKPLNFLDNADRFSKYIGKIRHVEARHCPYTTPQFGEVWGNEGHQRNAIKLALDDAAPNDLILVSDVDEIPDPDKIKSVPCDRYIYTLELRTHFYNWNWIDPLPTGSGLHVGAVAFKHFTSACSVRGGGERTIYYAGWHLSWFGNSANAKRRWYPHWLAPNFESKRLVPTQGKPLTYIAKPILPAYVKGHVDQFAAWFEPKQPSSVCIWFRPQGWEDRKNEVGEDVIAEALKNSGYTVTISRNATQPRGSFDICACHPPIRAFATFGLSYEGDG